MGGADNFNTRLPLLPSVKLIDYFEDGESGLLAGIDCGEKKDRVLEAGLPPIGADMGGRKLPFGLVGRKGGVPWYAPAKEIWRRYVWRNHVSLRQADFVQDTESRLTGTEVQ